MATTERTAAPGGAEERERRRVWVVAGGQRVTEADALNCGPSAPDYWWIPTIGYSVPTSALYASEADAVEAALREVGAAISGYRHREQQLLEQRARLRERRAGAGAGERGE